MLEPDRLSLTDLEHYGRVWGAGRERRALCPFCGDDHGRDQAHASLALNVDTGAWTCHRCNRSGMLEESKTQRDRGDPLRSRRPRRVPVPQHHEPAPADLAEEAAKRDTLRRLWATTVPLDAPLGDPGVSYLEGRGIPLAVAAAARVRYAANWYGRPAVVFAVQDVAGRLVAAESRYTDCCADPKSRSAGNKRDGVFVALPGALAADGVTLCEGPITALAVAACGFPALALCGHVVRPWLVRHLALRAVLLALDWYEAGADESAAAACRCLAAVGARVYRLAPPDGAGDFADYLQTAGRDVVRAELDRVIVAALMAGV